MQEKVPTAARPPGYELFLAPLQVALDPTAFERVNFAYIVSKFGHAKQTRDDGTRYFDHPKAAAWIYIDELDGQEARVIIDALLHDLSEDTYLLSPYRLGLNFGSEIALDVRALTKLPKGKEETPEYLHRIVKRGPSAIVAKLCDRLHNLRTVGTSDAEKIAKQIKETETYHVPILILALEDCGNAWKGHADALERKINSAITELRSL